MGITLEREILKILNANVAGQEWMGWGERAQVASKAFGDIHAHLIGFQESSPESLRVLSAARPELIFRPGQAHDDIYINSIAYDPKRLTLLDSGDYWLSEDGTRKPAWDGMVRGSSWAHLKDLVTGKEFLHVNSHWDNKSALARDMACAADLKFIQERAAGIGVIFTADMNVSVNSPHQHWVDPSKRSPYERLLQAGFIDALQVVGPSAPLRPSTYHAFKGGYYDPLRHDPHGTYDTDIVALRGFKPISARLRGRGRGLKRSSDHWWLYVKAIPDNASHLLGVQEQEEGVRAPEPTG
ncbi:MAG TPA: hypothetical protein VGB97_00315 [Candidatus Paceibacterota bacterium]|jgi:hypothetical protein